MNLPIPPSTLLAAARAATEIASSLASGVTSLSSGVSEAVGFDQVLREATPQQPVGELIEQTVAAIENKLRQLGIGVNRPLELSVGKGGRIEVASDHDRAAEIESRLAADPETSALADHLQRLAGPLRLTIGGPRTGQP